MADEQRRSVADVLSGKPAPPKRGPTDRISLILGRLDDDDRVRVIEALRDPTWPHYDLAKRLTEIQRSVGVTGPAVDAEQVSRWRRGRTFGRTLMDPDFPEGIWS